MNNTHVDRPNATQDHTYIDLGAEMPSPSDAEQLAPEVEIAVSTGQATNCPVPRGLTVQVGTLTLQDRIWSRSLLLVNRFRVIRTIDIAVVCFAERPFKAALSAAQRAVRGMVKARLLARYRTDRFMTVYGLTQQGVQWLDDRGFESSASVRRVTDMSNPEHRLWAQFLTVCAEARGLKALTEQELLLELNKNATPEQTLAQGLLHVSTNAAGRRRHLHLRPDAIAVEQDGLTWFEVDRSARGSDRAASLRALCLSIGARTPLGQPLRRVVVYTRTSRIQARVLATLDGLVKDGVELTVMTGQRHLRKVAPACYEVYQTTEVALRDGRTRLDDVRVGHVVVQELPIWLPRVRLDGRGAWPLHGWFSDNYLPYRRPDGAELWHTPASPLLSAPKGLKGN